MRICIGDIIESDFGKTRYGFDPDKEVQPLAQLSDAEYEENLLQHGVIR